MEAYPIKLKDLTVARSFVENFVLRHGILPEIFLDKDKEFISSTMNETRKLLNIDRIRIKYWELTNECKLKNTVHGVHGRHIGVLFIMPQ